MLLCYKLRILLIDVFISFLFFQLLQRLRDKPHEYACIGCEQKVSDHETIFESRESRRRRGAAVDESYIPLHDNAYLTSQAIEGKGKLGGRARPPVRGIKNGPAASYSSSSSSPGAGHEISRRVDDDAFKSCAESSADRYK